MSTRFRIITNGDVFQMQRGISFWFLGTFWRDVCDLHDNPIQFDDPGRAEECMAYFVRRESQSWKEVKRS